MKVSRTIVFILALAAFALSAAACGGNSGPSSDEPTLSPEAQKFAALSGNATNGKTKFEGTCTSCHGPDAKGISGLGKDLTTSEYAKGLPDAELAVFLTKGRPAADALNTTGIDMPPRGGNPALTDQDLVDIVAFLRSIQQ